MLCCTNRRYLRIPAILYDYVPILEQDCTWLNHWAFIWMSAACAVRALITGNVPALQCMNHCPLAWNPSNQITLMHFQPEAHEVTMKFSISPVMYCCLVLKLAVYQTPYYNSLHPKTYCVSRCKTENAVLICPIV